MNASLQLSEKSSVSPLYKHLYIQVIVAVIVGVVLGYFYPNISVQMKPFGDIFIKVTKMLIAPVVFLTVSTGIARMTDVKSLGGIFGKAMAYFSVFSILALVVGMVVANIVKPGAGMNVDPTSLDMTDMPENIFKGHFESFSHFLMDIIPETALKPFISGNILQTLFIAILFGVSLSLIGKKADLIKNFLEEMSFPIFKMISLVMRAAPLGAFGAMSYTVGKYGLSSISNLALLVGSLYLTSAFFIFVILGLLARLCGFSVVKLIRYLKEEILLVFSTSSSEAALPSLMEKMEKLGCHRSIVSIVVPTGYSFNLDGTNIYITLAALFIAQATNISLSVQDQISLLLIAIISSKGAAGVSGSGFVTLAATLSIFPALPIGGMSLILGIDRFMSECRSITNIIGNAVATIIVCRWENKLEQKDFHKKIGI